MHSDMEVEYKNKYILMVSHADTLQIAHMFLSETDPRLFSQYRFRNGEVSCCGTFDY
jgi:broad specificity phosphatase PhoE